jgi:hypothetical protein
MTTSPARMKCKGSPSGFYRTVYNALMRFDLLTSVQNTSQASAKIDMYANYRFALREDLPTASKNGTTCEYITLCCVKLWNEVMNLRVPYRIS